MGAAGVARIVGVVVAALAVPAPAAALEELGGGDTIQEQFWVTGQSVTFADGLYEYDDGFDVVEISADGGRRVHGRLPDAPARGGRFYQYTEFGASPRRFAFGFAQYRAGGDEDEPEKFAFRGGRPSETIDTLLDCRGDPGVPQVAVSDDAVAMQPGGCAGMDIVVRDFTPGAAVPTRTVPVTQQASELRLAGRHVAYMVAPDETPATSPERQVVVYDWVAGSEVYRARASEAFPFESAGSQAAFDLQADGKVAVLAPPQTARPDPNRACYDDFAVAWFSPAEPTPHVLPVAACRPYVAIEGDRIAFARGTGSVGSRIVVSDLAGSSVADVASFPQHRMSQAWDFDGARVGFSKQDCHSDRIFTEAIAPVAPASFEVPSCPVRIASDAGRIDAAGRVAVRYSCPRGCRIESRVREPFGSRFEFRRVRPGRATTMRFRVPRAVRARLERRGSLLIRVIAGMEPRVPVRTRWFGRWMRVRAR
jgi:hypothetical protein